PKSPRVCAESRLAKPKRQPATKRSALVSRAQWQQSIPVCEGILEVVACSPLQFFRNGNDNPTVLLTVYIPVQLVARNYTNPITQRTQTHLAQDISPLCRAMKIKLHR